MADATPARPRRVKEPQARTIFLALGPSRTLATLAEKLRQDFGDAAPSDRTIETWSSKHGWQALALAHDAEVAGKAGQLVSSNQAADLAALNITPKSVLQEVARIGFSNIGEFIEVQADGTAVIDLGKARENPDLMAAIQEIVVDEYTDGKGEDARPVKRVRVKLHAKLPALELLGQNMALWKGSGAVPPPPPSETHIHVNGNLVLVKQVHEEIDEIFGVGSSPALAAPNPVGRG